jgi:hypothetical protein
MIEAASDYDPDSSACAVRSAIRAVSRTRLTGDPTGKDLALFAAAAADSPISVPAGEGYHQVQIREIRLGLA